MWAPPIRRDAGGFELPEEVGVVVHRQRQRAEGMHTGVRLLTRDSKPDGAASRCDY